MSPSRSNAEPPADEHVLDEIAAELYALRPDGFVAARDDKVKQVREQGQAPLARAIAALRRPTQSAWLVNLLVRDQPDAVEELIELGDGLRKAHQNADGAELQEISAQRRKAEAGLLRRARALAAEADVDLTADMAREVEETLAAALVRPDVAEEVRSGRLTKPVAYSGFGTLLAAVPSPPAGQRTGRRTTEESRHPTPAGAGPERSGRASRQSTVERESRADKEREQRDAAAHRVEEAREALGTAAAELAVQGGSAQDATRRLEDLQSSFDELRAQIQQVEQQLGVAERVAKVEARRLDAARKAHQKAEADLKRAEENARR